MNPTPAYALRSPALGVCAGSVVEAACSGVGADVNPLLFAGEVSDLVAVVDLR